MFPQIACQRGCIVTLVAFIWFFSAVCFQMCPQMACLRGYIVTLIAFVWPFSTVCLHMCSQIVGSGRCKVTLVAIVWLVSIICLPNWNLPLSCFNWFMLLKTLFHHLMLLIAYECYLQCKSCYKLTTNWTKIWFRLKGQKLKVKVIHMFND